MVVAGSVFYGAFDWRFLGLLYVSIVVDFFVGRGLDGTDDAAPRKRLLATSLDRAARDPRLLQVLRLLLRQLQRRARLGRASTPTRSRSKILLPVGISFYTFQTLAYVFAVYRRQIEAERTWSRSPRSSRGSRSWWPGPSSGRRSLLPQIRRRRDAPERAAIESGADADPPRPVQEGRHRRRRSPRT